jgi:hypothetical protein
MNTNLQDFTTLLRFYNAQNLGRPTRLGVFEKQTHSYNDYWLESGLPFGSIELDKSGDPLAIQIFLDGFTHAVNGATNLKINFSFNGEEDGVDISDSEGNTTVLRFEKSNRNG